MPDPDKPYDQDVEEVEVNGLRVRADKITFDDGPQVELVYDEEGNVVAKRVALNIAAEMDEGKGPE